MTRGTGDRAGYPPIGGYAFLSDTHTAALLAPDGAVEWLCAPRFDGPSVFARMLDRERGGSFQLEIEGGKAADRRYLQGTLVLESRFETPSGTLVIHDFLALGADEGRDPAGLHPHHMLVRLLRCESGEVRCNVVVDARPDYARAEPHWRGLPGAPELEVPGARLTLHGDAEFELERAAPVAALHLRAGEERAVGLGYSDRAPAPIGADWARELFERTVDSWRAWSGLCPYDGVATDQVVHSSVVLRGLIFDETGALLAAPTTSLPEELGGVRNWDYRYTWHRDASLVILALFRLGHEREGRRYNDFLLEHEALSGELEPVIGIGGERDLEEKELDHLEGYARSRPVRLGNDARGQRQLDSAGHLLDAALAYQQLTGNLSEPHWRELRRVVDATARSWREPDHGIWEIRDSVRHHTHSKVLAWTCLDRAVKLAEALEDVNAPVDGWVAERDALRADILAHGYDQSAGAFVQSYGQSALDASLLAIPLLDFLPGDDPRVVGTVEAISAELSLAPEASELIRRYDAHEAPDGLPGEEGAFLLCSFDLVSALVLAGRGDEAQQRFERLLGRAGELGLFSEEMDAEGAMLGNFPQAFTHLALVEAALNLDERGEREALHQWAEDRGP